MELHTLAKGLDGFAHPIRVMCLVLLENEHSPSELHEICQQTDLAPTLGTVSYHMRMLKQYDMVYETRTEPRRGALEHFYRRTENADVILKTIGKLFGDSGLPKRGHGRPSKNGRRQTELLVAIGAMEAPDEVAMAA